MSVLGLILGIVGLVGGIICPLKTGSTVAAIIFIVIGVVGIVISAIGMKSGKGKGMAVAGLVLSIIAVIISIVLTLACVAGNTAKKALEDHLGVEDLANLTEEEAQSIADGLNELESKIEAAIEDAQK